MPVKKKKGTTATRWTFERAMKELRGGSAVRRRAWHEQSRIFRVGHEVFVKLPAFISRSPTVWKPYPQDFLATDWEKAA